jgi:hypothetical protein
VLLLYITNTNAQLLSISSVETIPPQDFVNRLIEIKYTSEMFIGNAIKRGNITTGEKDTAFAIYNTLRYKIDGLIYGLSTDLITANSPRKLRLLNGWCLQQSKIGNMDNIPKKGILVYTMQLKEIEKIFNQYILEPNFQKPKNIYLSTNIFYLLKDSYTIVKGLSDMKTQKTMALVEVLDHVRLMSTSEIAKVVK